MGQCGCLWSCMRWYWLLLQIIAIKSTCMYKNTTECLQILMWWYLFQPEQWWGPIGEDAGVGATAGTGPVRENENHCWSGEASVWNLAQLSSILSSDAEILQGGRSKIAFKILAMKHFWKIFEIEKCTDFGQIRNLNAVYNLQRSHQN